MEEGSSRMITVKYEQELELSNDEATEMIAQVLQEDFIFLTQEINELRNIGANLTMIQGADLVNNMNVRDAMRTLIKYYMVKEDYDAFLAEYGR
jgi:hypothetical protein